MKPKTQPPREAKKRSPSLTTQDLSFVRLAAAILEQPEIKIIESLEQIRDEKRKLHKEAA